MFQGATSFNRDIGNWDVSGTNINSMFLGATSFRQDLGNWDISNVIDMTDMFIGSLMDSSYNISSSRTLSGWFSTLNNGQSGQPISPTITNPPTGWPGGLFDFSYVFFDDEFITAAQDSPANIPTYGTPDLWNVSGVTDMSGAFFASVLLDENISLWDTGHVTDMSGMFRGCLLFNQDSLSKR